MTVPFGTTWGSAWAALAGLVAVVASFFPPSAPAGGDPAPAAAEAAGDAGADAADAGDAEADAGDGDPDPAAAAAADQDAEGEDEEDVGLAPEVANNPTRLRTRLRRTQRALGELKRAGVDQLRGPDGKLVDVTDLLRRAREFDSLDAMLRANPKLREFTQPAAAADAREPAAPAFDPASLPFETDSVEGQFFLKQAQTIHEQQQELRRLAARLDARDGQDVQRTIAQHESDWKSQTLAAANQIEDQGVRNIFVKAIYGQFYAAKQQGRLGKLNVKELITAELAGLKVGPETKKRAAAAAAQSIVQRNASLPKPATGGAPAAARRPAPAATTETAADVSRRLRQQHG